MIKTDFHICENKDADQLCGNYTADRHLCLCFKDSTIPVLLESKISTFNPSSVTVQASLCLPRLETPEDQHFRWLLITQKEACSHSEIGSQLMLMIFAIFPLHWSGAQFDFN